MNGSRTRRGGSALIPALLILSGLAVLVMAMISSAISGAHTTSVQEDDYRLAGSVESLSTLAAETLWSEYLNQQGGQAGTILSFRSFLSTKGVTDSGPGGAPAAGEGFDLLPVLALPVEADGSTTFNGTRIASANLVRRDEDQETLLWVTVQAASRRGDGLDRNPIERAAQQVWEVTPDAFAGFDFALLANNVNCIFCHANIDNVDRLYNRDSSKYGSYDRVRVGTLENLHIRRSGNSRLGDADADSTIAGTIYSRGTAVIQTGVPITDWSIQSLMSREFDDSGKLDEDAWGMLATTDFVPAGDPPEVFENLYLNYTADLEEMVDGVLPVSFPPPFPDDGGIDPSTGEPDDSGAGNRVVDDFEFDVLASDAQGVVSGGSIAVVEPGDSIDDINELANAFGGVGGATAIGPVVEGSVMLVGTPSNPIVIDQDVVIDGDLIISGLVLGEGSLVVRGNIYVPADLEYLDGVDGAGNRTFGYGPSGQRNALGLAAGGNILIGDYQRPSTLQPDGKWVVPGQFDIITGNPDTGDKFQDDWSFVLAEMAIFNRSEWSKTQALLPASAAEAAGPPSGWTAVNPDYDPAHKPRYYSYGPDTIVPLLTKGGYYFDPSLGSWVGGPETAIAWDTKYLQYADPGNPSDPYLFDASGASIAAVSSVTPTGGWIQDDLYKVVVEYLEGARPFAKPLTIDGLIYTNNAVFSIVNRATSYAGRTVLNGALIGADIGLLSPGYRDPRNLGGNQSDLSDYAIGLQLNYDKRVKDMLNVVNPSQVTIRRLMWDPAIGIQ